MARARRKFASVRETINAGQQETSALKAQYETSLADARRNADQLVDEKLKAVEQEVEEIRSKAKQDAQRILADAHTQTVAERDEMLNELRDQTAALAVELAAHILEREVSAADNQRIIDDFFRKVG
jgi:F-type H+-transporting ATPase subunit b